MRYFSLARKEALRSDFVKYRVGCAVVCGNRVLATAHNSEKTHTDQKHYNLFRSFDQNVEDVVSKVHAEVAALAKARYADVDWSKAEIYVWREMRGSRDHGLARPCKGCMEAIRAHGIRHIFYTGDEGYIYEFLDKEVS